MTERVITGKYYRILSDKVNRVWDRLSLWTLASDVYREDGISLEDTIGKVDGITSSVSSNSSTTFISQAGAKTISDYITKVTNSI